MRSLLRSWPARSLRVLYAFFYVILRLFLLTHCARFLLRSAIRFFNAFFTRFYAFFSFLGHAPCEFRAPFLAAGRPAARCAQPGPSQPAHESRLAIFHSRHFGIYFFPTFFRGDAARELTTPRTTIGELRGRAYGKLKLRLGKKKAR